MVGEASGAAESFGRRVDVLQVLALVLRHSGSREAGGVRMVSDESREQRRAAPMESSDEDQALVVVQERAHPAPRVGVLDVPRHPFGRPVR